MSQHIELVQNPLVILMQDPITKKIITKIHRPADWGHREYGLIICDLVRHVARAFDLPEADVWEWVDKERSKPTTAIKGSRA